MNTNKKSIKIIRFILAICVIIIFFIWQNNDIVQTNYTYVNEKIPKSFSGFKIVQISDLHNKEFGKNQGRLLNIVSKQAPDIIVVTGDLIDSRYTSIDKAMKFIEGAVKIAPVYYVTGNHELRVNQYNILKQKIEQAGAVILDNEICDITNEHGDTIKIVGLDDGAIYSDTLEQLRKRIDNSNFTILLSHQPEALESYCASELDLVFSGHAHGGQVRLPFIGGLVAPNQGFFPKYTRGLYVKDMTTMVVSRGLGNSIAPLRIFNRPEVVTVTLN